MTDPNAISTKEISPGIILHKQQLVGKGDSELIYVFKIEVQKLNILEFTADFTGSENVFLEGSDTLRSVTTIQPFSSQIVAKLLMKKDWKLKSKFKFTMKPAPKDLQAKYIQADSIKLNNELNHAYQVLRKYPLSVMAISDVVSILNSSHIKFIDLEFPPMEDSIFSMNMDSTALDTVIQWRRPLEFMERDPANGLLEPSIFYDTIEPNDIKQGSLGDCWFMSALASLAERPALVERLFLTKEVNPHGLYRVKLCKNGEWVTVTVDDYFPCYAMGGPIFSRAHGNELWVLILEKAYAKLHGSYFLLRGGYANEGLIDLTGCPSTSYNFEDPDVINLIKSGQLWDILRSSDDEGFLLNASTPGEDRWTEIGGPDDDGGVGLVPGHAYSVIQVKEIRSFKLLNIRNPWGKFEWNGDWCDKSPLWTAEIRKELNPTLEENDGTFWMSYQDFLQHFRSLNVCKVKNWDEVRIKGKFIRVQDIDDPNIEVVMSKWYYSLDVQEKSKIIIGLHQEDERIQGVLARRSYLDIGLVILKRTADGGVVLHEMKDLHFERQIEVEVNLEQGSYIILPRTTGCTLKRPVDAVSENIKLMDANGRLHDLASSTIMDIFRKYDMLLTRELTYVEFKGFFECLNKTLTQQEFENQILGNYASTQRGLTLQGFLDFFKDSIHTYGEETIYQWFELLGYDKDLYSIRSRCFILTFHSDAEISVVVRDNVQTDLDNRANILIVSRFGKEMEVRKGVRAFYSFSKFVHAYTYAVINDQPHPVVVTLDCTASKNMLFSTKVPIVKKRIEPGVLEFMLHAEAIPTADNFLRSAKCTWVPAAD